MSLKDKLAKLAEKVVLGSDPEQEAAEDLRKSQEAEKKEGEQ